MSFDAAMTLYSKSAITIVKMDIETFEYEVLPDVLQSRTSNLPRQVLLEVRRAGE